MKVHVVVPTYRESPLVTGFLQSWAGLSEHEVVVHVVNANPGDETSALLREWQGPCRVHEVAGTPDLYWTGLVTLGLKEVAAHAHAGEAVVLTNIDVSFTGDPVSEMLRRAGGLEGRQITVPVAGGDGRILSAGVEVRSWALSRNRHFYDGLPAEALPRDEVREATYLPTRLLLLPAEAVLEGHFPDAERLPHYCADYEYTNRLRRAGYRALVLSGPVARIAEENTGLDTFLRRTSLRARLRGLVDIKCPYNARFRYRFVRAVYPRCCFLPGLLSHFAKIALKVALGGRSLNRWRAR